MNDPVLTEEDFERKEREEWDQAARLARQGDKTGIIDFLRSRHDPTRVPDFSLLADLLEGINEFEKSKGRPSKPKITSGIEKLRIANSVKELMEGKGLSLEKAIAAVAPKTHASEGKVKQYYLECKSSKQI